MRAPEGVKRLVERFDNNLEAYRSGHYNETQVRVEFIDPLLEELGWDVYNRRGSPQTYRDVIHEDRLKKGGATKAPDYGFYVGGGRKFFLEAKKPSVDIREEVNPAVQLRRYAWTAGLPLSLLTDFEELAVYDCRFEPAKEENAATARLSYLTYDLYQERWEEIYSLFSREAVLEGSLERYAEEGRKKRGTQTVDEAFLGEIEGWRERLAHDMAARNNLNSRQLNMAVQLTIDRIIFLRMAEDRGVEEYGRLLALVEGPNAYAGLCRLFREADERYNSGLFHFRNERGRSEDPDELTLNLEVGDSVLKNIIGGLYYPESPYEFSVLPVEVLGQVYERFLGSVIHLEDGLEDGHRATVEQKPEVRKAGGVYYTPTYIVDYIVENTLGRLLEGKRPGPRGGASRLKIVDPACGSGSFLIGAYEYLLDWHRDRYLEDGPEKHSKRLYQGKGGQWFLTIDEKKRILKNNIYGVDIDPQAVEVTKLSLLLKVLEGESQQTVESQLSLFNERALPDLSDNIQCGNSLIGPDFYDNVQMGLLEEEEHYRINVFDWRQAFPHVFEGDSPGFDAVIGNPPYIRIQSLKEFAPLEVEHYKEAYKTASKGNYDIYVAFVERGLGLLNKSGKLGYIVPHKFFNAKYGEPLRQLIAQGKNLSKIVHFGDEQVFAGATNYTALLFLDKSGNRSFRFVKADDLIEWRARGEAKEGEIPAERATAGEWNFVVGPGAGLFEKLKEMSVKLGDMEHLFVGLQTSADSIYILTVVEEGTTVSRMRSRSLGDVEVDIETPLLHPLLKGSEIPRYREPEYRYMVLFPYRLESGVAVPLTEKEISTDYPLAYDYLSSNKTALLKRSKIDSSNWWLYPYPKNLSLFSHPKILSQVLSTRGTFAPDFGGRFYFLGGGTAGGYGISISDNDQTHHKYLLDILNSRLTTFYVSQIASGFRAGFFAFGKSSLTSLPIRTVEFSDSEDKARHDEMVELVERMLDLHQKLAEAKISREKTVIGRQIEATDRQIDRLVYELYELSQEEIEIVEQETR